MSTRPLLLIAFVVWLPLAAACGGTSRTGADVASATPGGGDSEPTAMLGAGTSVATAPVGPTPTASPTRAILPPDPPPPTPSPGGAGTPTAPSDDVVIGEIADAQI